jgi:hypothetical protein
VNEAGASNLKITTASKLPFPSFLLGPEWGLHLIDTTLTKGDLVALAAKQASACR